jgi:hypothetical protein
VRFIGDIGAGPCAFPYSDECQSLIMAHDVAPETGIAKSVVDNALGMKVSYLINTTLLERCMAGDNDAGSSKASSVWREPKVFSPLPPCIPWVTDRVPDDSSACRIAFGPWI